MLSFILAILSVVSATFSELKPHIHGSALYKLLTVLPKFCQKGLNYTWVLYSQFDTLVSSRQCKTMSVTNFWAEKVQIEYKSSSAALLVPNIIDRFLAILSGVSATFSLLKPHIHGSVLYK